MAPAKVSMVFVLAPDADLAMVRAEAVATDGTS